MNDYIGTLIIDFFINEVKDILMISLKTSSPFEWFLKCFLTVANLVTQDLFLIFCGDSNLALFDLEVEIVDEMG